MWCDLVSSIKWITSAKYIIITVCMIAVNFDLLEVPLFANVHDVSSISLRMSEMQMTLLVVCWEGMFNWKLILMFCVHYIPRMMHVRALLCLSWLVTELYSVTSLITNTKGNNPAYKSAFQLWMIIYQDANKPLSTNISSMPCNVIITSKLRSYCLRKRFALVRSQAII